MIVRRRKKPKMPMPRRTLGERGMRSASYGRLGSRSWIKAEIDEVSNQVRRQHGRG